MTPIIETIKAKIDVAEEIGLVVMLQKSGKSLKGLCPFHNERTPSFYVFPESQTWHCFGCNEGGDIFSFVQKQQSLAFLDALEYLAGKAGVALADNATGRSSQEEREASASRERLRQLNDEALLWFHHMLLRAKEAEEARAYVQSRGISVDSIIAFGLGYAPDQWEGLTPYLLSRGYTEHELVMGGLARASANDGAEKNNGGRVYDYFRNRLIFPIRDIRGRVIGFGGRALGDGKPKYLNSPQTPLFEKSGALYAIDMARDAIKNQNQVVIVEGYVDAVIAHQYGTRQTVACIGSAITEKHIQQLKKLTKQVTLALDPDAAGSAATEHGIQEALKSFDRKVVPVVLPSNSNPEQHRPRGKARKHEPQALIRLEEQVDAEINVLRLPAGQDPDEVIRRDYGEWLYGLTHPVPLFDYYFTAKTRDLDLSKPADQAKAAKRLLPLIGIVRDRSKQDVYVRDLAHRLRIDEQSLSRDLKALLIAQTHTAGIVAQFSEPVNSGAAKAGQQPDGAPVRQEDQPVQVSEDEAQTSSALYAANANSHGKKLDRSGEDKLQWEDYLIGLLLQNPGLSPYVCGIINVGDFAGTDTRELYHILSSVYEQRASSPSLQSFEQMVPPALLDAVARARGCVESSAPKDEARLVKEAEQCATRLKRAKLLQLNTEINYLLREATVAGETAEVRQLLLRLSSVYRDLRAIDSATHLQG